MLKKKQNTRKIQLIGWGLFVLCSILYIISSILSQDWINLIGSIIFFVACLVFMYPLIKDID